MKEKKVMDLNLKFINDNETEIINFLNLPNHIYSMWFESEWYIFWNFWKFPLIGLLSKEKQMLAIWHLYDDRFPSFSYKELKEIKTIEDLKSLLKLPFKISDLSYEKCLNRIKTFIDDMDRIFGV